MSYKLIICKTTAKASSLHEYKERAKSFCPHDKTNGETGGSLKTNGAISWRTDDELMTSQFITLNQLGSITIISALDWQAYIQFGSELIPGLSTD